MVVIIDPKTREASDIYQDLEVELLKKPGKGLGLSVVGRRDGNGVFISDMVRQTIIRYYSGDPNTRHLVTEPFINRLQISGQKVL